VGSYDDIGVPAPEWLGSWAWLLALAVVALLIWSVALGWRGRRHVRWHIERDPYIEGLNLMLMGRLQEAVQALTEAASANTGNIDAYLKLGSLYRRLGKPRRAAQIHLELSVRGDLPRQMKATIYRELAVDLEQVDNIERAFNYLRLSRELDPRSTEDNEIHLRLLEKQGRWHSAADTLRKVTSVNGKSDMTRLALYKLQEGEALCAENREHEGRICFKEAYKHAPDVAEAMLFIADSYARDGRGDEALTWFSRFISEHPESAQLAIPMLERLLFEAGRFSEIESILREAFQKAPDNRQLAAALVDLLMKKGEIDEALVVCERTLEVIPDDVDIRLYRLRLLHRKEDDTTFDRSLDELLALRGPFRRGYYCSNCGYHSEHLHSRCPECEQWRSFFGDRRANANARH